jgi:tRNA pseudouridine38-40 synthase
MRAAARPFVGMRDFRSFAAADAPDDVDEPAVAREAPRRDKSTLVLIDRLDIVEDGDLILIGVEGSHFLWKMVRRMVGVLVEVGRGGLEPGAVSAFLAEGSAAPARLTAPPSGLFLERVYYKGDGRGAEPRAVTPLQKI